MRIAYVAVGFEMDIRLGVVAKLERQMSRWVEAGHEARLFIQAHRMPNLVRDGKLGSIPVEIFPDDRVAGVRLAAGLTRRFSVVSALADRVAAWRAELVYVRFNTWYPALTALAARVPTVLEINTDDVREYRMMMSAPQFLYHRLGRGWFMRRAAGMVYVTHELAANPSLARFGRPGVVVSNGIRLAEYPTLPPPSNDRPRLTFIGSAGHPWHGVDKILRLATLCPDWDFDLIGLDAGAAGRELPPNVVCHGYLLRRDYEAIMARADVAIGTLALHRKAMREASPLKVREYLAYGIPAVIGYRDTDFLNGSDYLLALPNIEDNVESCLPEIRAFVGRMRGVRVPREAIMHVDSARKEAERLAFFEHVVRRAAAGRGAAPTAAASA